VILFYLLCVGFLIDQRSVKEEEKEDNNYDDIIKVLLPTDAQENCFKGELNLH
jgi:hypothetical protein